MRKERFKESTIASMVKQLKILGNKADLENVEAVKETIATHSWTDGFKRNLSDAYWHFAK